MSAHQLAKKFSLIELIGRSIDAAADASNFANLVINNEHVKSRYIQPYDIELELAQNHISLGIVTIKNLMDI